MAGHWQQNIGGEQWKQCWEDGCRREALVLLTGLLCWCCPLGGAGTGDCQIRVAGIWGWGFHQQLHPVWRHTWGVQKGWREWWFGSWGCSPFFGIACCSCRFYPANQLSLVSKAHLRRGVLLQRANPVSSHSSSNITISTSHSFLCQAWSKVAVSLFFYYGYPLTFDPLGYNKAGRPKSFRTWWNKCSPTWKFSSNYSENLSILFKEWKWWIRSYICAWIQVKELLEIRCIWCKAPVCVQKGKTCALNFSTLRDICKRLGDWDLGVETVWF